MKKIVVCFLCLIPILSGCAYEKNPAITPDPTIKNNVSLIDNIYFRRGETTDGEILFTQDVLQKVSVYGVDSSASEYGLLFTFTETGKQMLYQVTSQLSQTGEKLSIWIGNEQISCATVTEALSQGEMVLSGLSFTLDSATELCNRFYGIVPASTPTPMIAQDALNSIFSIITGTFFMTNLKIW